MVTLVSTVSTTDCDSVRMGSNPIRYPTNGRQHWRAAETYKLGRSARWAETARFKS